MQIDRFIRGIPGKITVILTEDEKTFFERHPGIKYSSFVREAIDRAIDDVKGGDEK